MIPARKLLAQIEQILAAKPALGMLARNATWGPLEESLALLQAGRRYRWLELVLKLDQGRTAAYTLGARTAKAASSEWISAVRIAGHDFGELHVLPQDVGLPGPEDRILLKQVARALAAFLGGAGKYLLTRARLQAARVPGTERGEFAKPAAAKQIR